jgi:hypothetical protein
MSIEYGNPSVDAYITSVSELIHHYGDIAKCIRSDQVGSCVSHGTGSQKSINYSKVLADLKCATELLSNLKLELMSDRDIGASQASNGVIGAARALFAYLTEHRSTLVTLDSDRLPITEDSTSAAYFGINDYSDKRCRKYQAFLRRNTVDLGPVLTRHDLTEEMTLYDLTNWAADLITLIYRKIDELIGIIDSILVSHPENDGLAYFRQMLVQVANTPDFLEQLQSSSKQDLRNILLEIEYLRQSILQETFVGVGRSVSSICQPDLSRLRALLGM